jgi:AraC family transcriptional regulator
MEEELTLQDMAQAVGLSTAYFGQMFRKSKGESPHQVVLHQRVGRAKEMLLAVEARVLDRGGMRLQNTGALCAGVPRDLRRQPYGIQARIREPRS